MPYKNLSVSLSDQQKEEILTKISELKTLLPFLVHLTPEEKVRLRTIGEKRQGYVNDMVAAVKANPTAIPASINTEEYYKDSKLFNDMNDILAHVRPLFEGIIDTYMASGNEAITVSDQCYGHLKQAARGNSSLTLTVKEIGKHFQKTGQKQETSKV